MHRILKQALAIAVRWRMLAHNPVDTVDPPKVERRKMAALDAQETARLLAHSRSTRMFCDGPSLGHVRIAARRDHRSALGLD